jgi:uncharacterized protein (DUF983 family)
MCASELNEKPNLLLSVLQNKCPRCRRGKLYLTNNPYDLRNFMKMHSRCPVCGQLFDMEPGFFYGTGFVSYGLAVLFSAITLILWWILIGLSTDDARFFWWMGINALLLFLIQPPLMRLSRTIWLYFFVRYSPNWDKGDVIEPDRVNADQMNNW